MSKRQIGFRGFWIILLTALPFLFGPLLASADQKKELPSLREKDLPLKYQEWLKLVSYIILPVEKDVFLKLAVDRERDIFIETFWKQRDPTPSTPENEFKMEHIRRFNYANSFYRRGTTREGWMTDMGRTYIILGAPANIERFEGVAGIYTCQVWYYYGDAAKKLPTYFALVFYQPRSSGEFKLYNPASDGPASLLVNTQGLDVTNGQAVYNKIKELAPTLAGVSISLIPGEYPYAFQPSPQSNIILKDIYDSPRKNISAAYATHFLNYKGFVSTEYMTNYIESTTRTALLEEPILGIRFLHFAVSPKSFSVDFYEPKNQYFCNFKMDVSLKKSETTIFQYSKDFPLYFSPDQAENIRANGLSVQDSFPVIEGTYELTILLQNSVGKEFSIYEGNVAIPGDEGPPQIVGPVMGYKLQASAAAVHAAFRTMDKQLFIDPNATISPREEVAFLADAIRIPEELWKSGEVAVLIRGLKGKDAAQKSFSIKLSSFPKSGVINIGQAVPAADFPPDYYEVVLHLKNAEGKILDTKTSNFVVSPQVAIPHPVTLSKGFPLANVFLYYSSLAYQYDKAGEAAKAEACFEKSLVLKPDSVENLVEFANFLVRTGKYDKALALIEKVKNDARQRFGYYLIKGKAKMGLGLYKEAIDDFLEGNKIYNSDTGLLNSLGFCFYQTRQKKEAIDAFAASLRLNPNQPDVKALMAKIEKELK